MNSVRRKSELRVEFELLEADITEIRCVDFEPAHHISTEVLIEARLKLRRALEQVRWQVSQEGS